MVSRTLQALAADLDGGSTSPCVLALQPKKVEEWSYRRMAGVVRRLASGLSKQGVRHGDSVAICAENSVEWMVASLAVLAAGGIVVPIDAQFGDAALTHALNDSEAKLLFTSSVVASRLKHLKIHRRLRRVLLVAESLEQLMSDEKVDFPAVEVGDVAALFYTSGTTGRPKGVPLTHANLTFELEAITATGLVSQRDRLLLPLPLHHVYPFVIGMLLPATLGAAIVLPQSLTGPEIVRALRLGRVTILLGVPRLYRALYDGIEARVRSSGRVKAKLFGGLFGVSQFLRQRCGLRAGKVLLYSLHRQIGPWLRVAASGGAALEDTLQENLETLGWQVGIGYGLTETAPLLTLNPPGHAKIGSAGKPISGVEIRLDASGEILARGPNVFHGYHHLPADTKKAFAGGWFRTGDLGRFDNDGDLFITGRASTLIVMQGGEKVQPEDVEEAYEESEAIREAGVLQADGKLIGVIVPERKVVGSSDGETLAQAIRQAVQSRARGLPSYQQLSDYVITRDPLPRTRLGKIQRHKLVERYEQARHDRSQRTATARGPMPVEEMSSEDRVLLDQEPARRVWDWLVQRYADKHLTPDTSPQLDLGVDSMEWLNLTLELQKRIGIELSEGAIAEVETVRDLLQKVTEAAGEGEVRPTQLLDEPEKVLSHAQKHSLEPLGPLRANLATALFHVNRALMRGLFRLRVEGAENLPQKGPFILTPNHVSFLDPFAVAAALSNAQLRHTHWAGWTGAAFRNAFFRFVSRLGQAVPIDPERAVMSSLAFGATVLERGQNLVWFPEGQRSADGTLQPFKPGIGILLEHFDVPVVPVFIDGSFEAWPASRRLPRLRRITVRFDEPLELSKLRARTKGARAQRKIVEQLHERVRQLAGKS